MDWLHLPPLTSLRAFAAYAEHGSVQKAGDALNVSHAAISQQIRNLESHLGLRLLDRSGRTAALTAEGRQLAGALKDGFGAIATVIAALVGADDARPLHVTTTPSFAANWLLPRLPDFRARHPGLDIMIDPNPSLTDPQPGGIDIAIRYGKGAWSGLQAEPLVMSGMCAVAAPDLIGDRVISTPEDLRGLPWLEEIGQSEATVWLSRHGITGPIEGSTTALPGNLALDAARSGQGIALTAMIWVAEDVRAGRLRVLFEEDSGAGYHIVTAPGAARPPLKSFLRWLRGLSPMKS